MMNSVYQNYAYVFKFIIVGDSCKKAIKLQVWASRVYCSSSSIEGLNLPMISQLELSLDQGQ